MRFAPTEQATALRQVADAVLNDVTSDIVRAGWPSNDPTAVAAIWRRLATTGVLGALVDEAHGGLGLSPDEAVPLFESLGASGLPVPAAETIAVAGPLLAAFDHPELDGVLDGTVTAAACLDGTALVPFGQSAQLILLNQGDVVRLHHRDDVQVQPQTTVDGSRQLAKVTPTAAGFELGRCDSAFTHGVVATSALLVGLARRMLSMTVDYVGQRRQFGVAIGSFQAIKHALASAFVAVQFAAPAVSAAGYALRTGDGCREAAAAKVLASDAARLVARTAIQCHGAMGYTTEYDLHLFAKRAWALAASWGDSGIHRARLATSLGV